jgi:hypothetical protein
MKKAFTNKALADFRDMIVQVRGVSVILDSDLARAYGVTTGALNQAVKRNSERFPDEFIFVIPPQEVARLKSQIVTSNPEEVGVPRRVADTATSGRGGRRKATYALTEHGALMAAMILNSPQEEAQETPRPRIGFSVRERRAAYRTKRTNGST